MKRGLRFQKIGGLEWDVMEPAQVTSLWGGKYDHTYSYAGCLRFGTGVDEGWWFISSDDSIKWNLGPRIRDAKAELQRRYRAGQRKAKSHDDRAKKAGLRNALKAAGKDSNRARRRTTRR